MGVSLANSSRHGIRLAGSKGRVCDWEGFEWPVCGKPWRTVNGVVMILHGFKYWYILEILHRKFLCLLLEIDKQKNSRIEVYCHQ